MIGCLIWSHGKFPFGGNDVSSHQTPDNDLLANPKSPYMFCVSQEDIHFCTFENGSWQCPFRRSRGHLLVQVSFRWSVFTLSHSYQPINISQDPHLMLPGWASSREVVYDTTSIKSVQLCYPHTSLITIPCGNETCTYFASHSRICFAVFVFFVSPFRFFMHCLDERQHSPREKK